MTPTMPKNAPHNPPVPATQGQAVLLYDGACPLCQRSVRILKKLNWLNKIHFQDARDTRNLPPSEVPLVPRRLLEEMHVVAPDRKRIFAGFKAFRWIAWRMPLTVLLAPFLYLPGIPWLGNKIYLWVAKNRFRLVPCKDGVCQLPARG
jgi:predicted DCC family thiol-disulfide oxidoreductase YuxK